jgi:hypothetical protein
MDSALIPVKVECHSGYKADEYPVCFYLGEARFGIIEITDRWYQGDTNPEFPAADYFKVLTFDGNQHIIKHEIKPDRWYLYE